MPSIPHRPDARRFDVARCENPDHWPPEEPAPAEPSAADLRDLGDWLDQLDDVPPTDDQVEDARAFPRPADADERRRFAADVAEFYRTNPGA
jgi:hypothetical protein